MPRWNNMLGTSSKIQELKREAVLKEAGRAFNERGYHNTSLDDVARTLQISKGSLYNYVKDKEEILFECHKIANGISERALDHGIKQGGTGIDVLRNVLTYLIKLLTTELGSYGVLTEMDALNPEHRELIASERARLAGRMNRIIRQGMADGSVRRMDPNVVLMTLMGSVNWLPRWYSPTGALSADEVAVQVTDLLLNGVSSTPPQESATPPADLSEVAPRALRAVHAQRTNGGPAGGSAKRKAGIKAKA